MATEAKTDKHKKLELYGQCLSMICLSGPASFTFPIKRKPVDRSVQRRVLENWDVKDADSLKEMLNWLLCEGRRENYERQAYYLSALPESERLRYIGSLKEEKLRTEFSIVHYYLRRLPAGGIAAVDFAWCAFMCRAGLEFHYMGQDDYWTYLLQITRAAQRSYSGWSEYVNGFAAGVQYVDADLTFDYVSRNRPVLTKLLASPHSPYRQVDWNMVLEKPS
jgi:hypothetical protein